MKKRYQVFVSSTFEDLKDERAKVMETILNFDCFPSGMEMFPAMDEEQFKYIKRIIDDSDYYLLIIGGRYGSVDENGVSWTEKEFDYAIEKGIPVMAFVIDDSAYNKLPQDKMDDKDIDKKREYLKAFKKKVSSGRLINKWTDANGLALAVAKSLKVVLELQPRIGWVRADRVPSGEAQKEIDRLQKVIENYVNRVNKLEGDLEIKDGSFRLLETSKQEALNESEKYQEEIRNLQEELHKIEEYTAFLEESNESFQDTINQLKKELDELLTNQDTREEIYHDYKVLDAIEDYENNTKSSPKSKKTKSKVSNSKTVRKWNEKLQMAFDVTFDYNNKTYTHQHIVLDTLKDWFVLLADIISKRGGTAQIQYMKRRLEKHFLNDPIYKIGFCEIVSKTILSNQQLIHSKFTIEKLSINNDNDISEIITSLEKQGLFALRNGNLWELTAKGTSILKGIREKNQKNK